MFEDTYFKRKKLNKSRLSAYGFEEASSVYRYATAVMNGTFILTVSKRKLGLQEDEMVEIIDLKLQPERIERIIDKERYFPAWHMNKKNWCTIILDNSVATEEICKRIDESYQLAVK